MAFEQIDGNQKQADEIMDKINQSLDSSDDIKVDVKKEAIEAMEFKKGESLVDKLKALAAQEDFGEEHLGEKENPAMEESIVDRLLKLGQKSSATEAEYSESEINAERPKTGIYGDVTQNQAAAENVGREDPSFFDGIVFLSDNPGAFAYICSAEINGKEMPVGKGVMTSDEYYDYIKRLGEVVKLGMVHTMYGDRLDTYKSALHDSEMAEESLTENSGIKTGVNSVISNFKESLSEGLEDSEFEIPYKLVDSDKFWDSLRAECSKQGIGFEVDEKYAIPNSDFYYYYVKVWNKGNSAEENLSKGMTAEDIAKKHKVSADKILEQVKKGIKVEKEHTDDEKKAERIALDHLFEMPDYYDRLAKMEKGATEAFIKPKYYDTMFGERVRRDYDTGKLTYENIKEWDKKLNGGVAPEPGFNTKEILDYYTTSQNKQIGDATEDTVKQGNSWVNKGKEGTHGKFKTKKAADAQRKAMFARGYQANENLIEGKFILTPQQKEFIKYDLFDQPEDYDINSIWEITSDKSKDPVRNPSDDEAFPYVLLINGNFIDSLSSDYISKIMKIKEPNNSVVEEIGDEEMYGFEAMSTPDLEAFQAVIADQLNSEGSISTLEKLMDRDITFDFTEQINYIKNTSDLSNTNEVLNEILKAAETLLDDIQIETLVEELSKDELEEPKEMVDQEFEEYQEPEDWSKVDETEEVVEEEPTSEEGNPGEGETI